MEGAPVQVEQDHDDERDSISKGHYHICLPIATLQIPKCEAGQSHSE